MKASRRMLGWLGVFLVLIGGSAFGRTLVISEIAWAGTAGSASDEWIELQNTTDETIALDGWILIVGELRIPLGAIGDNTIEVRTAAIPAGGFFILERTDDTAIADVTADLIFKGTLPNAGVSVELRDASGELGDRVDMGDMGWPAGAARDGSPPYGSMERRVDGGWENSNGIIRNGTDVAGNPLNATPGEENSVNVLARLAPTLVLHHPAEAGSRLSGEEIVTWTASDPDGSAVSLAIAIYVSESEGDWRLLVENLANTGSFVWDTSSVGSHDAVRLLIRAIDPDGYIGEVVSPVFEIAN